MPVMALVKPGSGHDGEDTDRPGGARRGVGHHAGRSLVSHEQVRHPLALRASQNSLFWAPGMPKTQRTPWHQRAAAAACAPVILPCTPSAG